MKALATLALMSFSFVSLANDFEDAKRAIYSRLSLQATVGVQTIESVGCRVEVALGAVGVSSYANRMTVTVYKGARSASFDLQAGAHGVGSEIGHRVTPNELLVYSSFGDADWYSTSSLRLFQSEPQMTVSVSEDRKPALSCALRP